MDESSIYSIIPELSKQENIDIVTVKNTQKYHMKVMYFSSSSSTTASKTYEFKQRLHPFTTNYVGGVGGTNNVKRVRGRKHIK